MVNVGDKVVFDGEEYEVFKASSGCAGCDLIEKDAICFNIINCKGIVYKRTAPQEPIIPMPTIKTLDAKSRKVSPLEMVSDVCTWVSDNHGFFQTECGLFDTIRTVISSDFVCPHCCKHIKMVNKEQK